MMILCTMQKMTAWHSSRSRKGKMEKKNLPLLQSHISKSYKLVLGYVIGFTSCTWTE